MSSKRKSKARKWIIIGIIVMGLGGLAWLLLLRSAPNTYENITAQTGDITTYYSFSGNVDTKNRETITSERIMQISDIKVEEGQKVKEGDVLITSTTRDEIKAGIAGEVVNITVEENAQVMAGLKLLEIVDYDNLEIKVKVDEYDITALESGREATVRIGALDKEIKGKISKVSKEGQIVSGVTFFTATVDLEKDEKIKIGMSAEVKLISNNATGIITLPMTAIQFDENNKPYVFKRGEKDAVVKSEIVTGINDGTKVEVKSGVISGETVLYKKPAAIEDMRFGRDRDDRREEERVGSNGGRD